MLIETIDTADPPVELTDTNPASDHECVDTAER